MILFLLKDGRTREVYDCEDVIHKPGYITCLNYEGSPITTFASEEVLGYTLNPHLARAMREAPRAKNRRITLDSLVFEKWWNHHGRGS